MNSSVPARKTGKPVKKVPNRHWRKRFIETLATTSNAARAAEVAKVSLTRAYDARRTEPAFARAWQAAIADGYLNLEIEMIRRLRDGDLMTANGDKFDFANAIRLLGARQGSAGGQSEVRDVSTAEVRASINRKIEDIRRRMERQRAAQDSAE